MKDEAFIKLTLQKGKDAKEKVMLAFSNLSPDQLNWKPSAESWSIAQCLDHLIVAHNVYFPDLEKITAGTYKMSFWERYSPFTAICGRNMKGQLQEQVKTKMKAPAKIRPAASNLRVNIIENYYNNLSKFLQYISGCQNIDIDRTVINSPLIGIVTYNLRDAFQFLLQHEHRHINQAMRVKANENFPR